MNVVITGAGRGIGLAMAEYYANSPETPKTNLLLITRTPTLELNNFISKYKNEFLSLNYEIVDVINQSKMHNVLTNYANLYGSPDILIANAGVAVTNSDNSSVLECAILNMNSNYFGVINTIVPLIDYMKTVRRGRIAIISSIASYRATFNSGEYSASKAAINLWAESLRLNLSNYGVSVSIVKLGFVDTAMTMNNKFKMYGIISARRAAKLIIERLKSGAPTYLIPYKSSIIWLLLNLAPNRIYDIFIKFAARKML